MHDGKQAPAREPQAARDRGQRWLVALLVLAVLVRIILLLVYEPVSFGDSASYLRLAEALRGIGSRGYDGTRVPGYPAFLALLNADPKTIWAVQMLLGVLISLMLYWILDRLTGQPRLGFILGALYSLIPGQFLFEAAILTETLTSFFIVSSVALLVWLKKSAGKGLAFFCASLLGIAASLAGLTRPLFFPLTIALLPFVWWLAGGSVGRRVGLVAAYSFFPLLLQGGWLMYMWRHWHVVSPTAMAGFSMVQHAGSYFEYLPDRYAALRDVYIQYRDAQIAARGVQTNAIWEAIPALSQASGLGFYDLSREMGRLSWLLIREHPGLYLRDVIAGWIAFWKAPVYWQPALIHPEIARFALSGLAWLGRALSVAANGAFLLLSPVVLGASRIRRTLARHPLWLSSALMIWLISLVQTLLDHGDNPRFLVPLQMLVFLTLLLGYALVRVEREGPTHET